MTSPPTAYPKYKPTEKPCFILKSPLMSYSVANELAPFDGLPLKPKVEGWNAPPPEYHKSFLLLSDSECTSLRMVRILPGRSITSPNSSVRFMELKNGKRA